MIIVFLSVLFVGLIPSTNAALLLESNDEIPESEYYTLIENPCLQQLNTYTACLGPEVGVCLADYRSINIEDLTCDDLDSEDFWHEMSLCTSDYSDKYEECVEVEERGYLLCLAMCANAERSRNVPTYSPTMGGMDLATNAALESGDDDDDDDDDDAADYGNHPCKDGIDAVTNCFGSEFPECVESNLGSGSKELVTCEDLVDNDFTSAMLICAYSMSSYQDCEGKVSAAEECIYNKCSSDGVILALQ